MFLQVDENYDDLLLNRNQTYILKCFNKVRNTLKNFNHLLGLEDEKVTERLACFTRLEDTCSNVWYCVCCFFVLCVYYYVCAMYVLCVFICVCYVYVCVYVCVICAVCMLRVCVCLWMFVCICVCLCVYVHVCMRSCVCDLICNNPNNLYIFHSFKNYPPFVFY